MKNLLKNLFKKNKSRFVKDDKKINLLIEVDSFDKGGLQKVILDHALFLDKEKFNPVIVNINKAGHMSKIALAKGIKTYNLAGLFNKAKKYSKIIKKENINLSCSHFSNFGYKILKNNKIPNITFIHNVYAFLDNSALQKFKENDLYVDLYISVSKNATIYANKILGIPNKKIITISNGLNIDEHLQREKNINKINRNDFGLAKNDYIFLNVASYNLHKGHYLMADAMKNILKKRKNIKILCIGNIINPNHIEEFQNYLNKEGLNKHIIMPGYFSNIESFYNITDAFLLPSFIEGWSIAMNEAMFYRKPMILTDTGGSSEVIENNDIGIIIKNEYGNITDFNSQILDDIAYNKKNYNTANDLAAAMIKFTDNEEYWKNAGKKGRDKIIKYYNLKNTIIEYEKIFSNLAKSYKQNVD